jgi:general stress protein YciG
MVEKTGECGKMSRQEVGRKGGYKVAIERGSEFYKEIGKKGGESRGNKSRTVNQKFT